MVHIKSFAYLITLKREFKAGYLKKMPVNPTKVKYFKFLIKSGLIVPTKNGFQLRNLRAAFEKTFGHQFSINAANDKSLSDLSTTILESAILNRLRQHVAAAKYNLGTIQGRVVKRRGINSIEARLMAGDVTAMTSCRSIAKHFNISHTLANTMLNKLVKKKWITFQKLPKNYEYFFFNGVDITFNCQRFLTSAVRITFESCV